MLKSFGKLAFTLAMASGWLLLAVAKSAGAADDSGFVITSNGQPVAAIVADASEALLAKGNKKREAANDTSEAGAAALLAEWIKKITGANLPIAREAKEGVPAIYLGKAAVRAGLKLDDIESPSHEAVRIVADSKRVLIAGQNDAATVKAVCRFLEELGCRWFMDGPLGEVYPHTPTLTVGKISITEKPGLIGRNPKGPSLV